MSLINQMLRDLQHRQSGRPEVSAVSPARRPRRQFQLRDLLRNCPPIVWVGAAGVVGIALIIGLSGWLSTLFDPGASLPVPPPPADMVAIARAPSRPATEVAQKVPLRTPPIPLEVPPPAPPLAYGESSESAGISPRPAVEPAPASASTPVLPVERPTLAVAVRPPVAVSSQALPTGLARERVADLPRRLHPDILPGAVNATNLALQQAAAEIAVPPPAATPFGQAEVAYRQGRQAYEANRTEASLEALRRALEFYPGHLPARELLADQYEMAGRTDEAFVLLQQGLAIAPDYTPLRKRMARILLDRGNAAGAVRALIGPGLPRVEEDPELHRMLAGTYQQLGEYFLAAQTYRNLLAADPQNGAVWVGLGDVLATDGQPGEARKAYRRALASGGLSVEQAARAGQGALRR